jgi:hypothetical protein
MTKIQMQAQIDAIERVTKEALRSRETALQFLIDAGIERKSARRYSLRAPNKKKN